MLFLLSLSLLSMILFIVALQIRFYNQLQNDRFRFAYFALRDRLSTLVLREKIAEDSWEYQQLVEAINYHIHAVDSVSLSRITRLIASYHMSSKEDRQVSILTKKVDHEDIKILMIDFLELTKCLLRRNSRAQIKAFEFLRLHKINKPRTSMGLNVAKPKQALERIEKNVTELTSSLEPVCA